MGRRASLLAGFLLATMPLALAQTQNPKTPEDAFTTRELIAWSQMQKPQPTPQPLPPRDTPIPEPDQPQDQRAKPPADPQTQQEPAAQSFTGKILRQGSGYVLKADRNTTYQLDGEGDLSKFENQTVKVIGNLDAGKNTIRVVKVELLS